MVPHILTIWGQPSFQVGCIHILSVCSQGEQKEQSRCRRSRRNMRSRRSRRGKRNKRRTQWSSDHQVFSRRSRKRRRQTQWPSDRRSRAVVGEGEGVGEEEGVGEVEKVGDIPSDLVATRCEVFWHFVQTFWEFWESVCLTLSSVTHNKH